MKSLALVLLGFFLSFAVCDRALAQSTTDSKDEFSFYLGQDLPNQIDGVTEILPVFGGRYGWQTQRLGLFQLGLFNTHAKGVDFTTVEAGLRGLLPISVGTDAFYYGGLDFNYYLPENADSRKSVTGFHVGAGAMLQVTDTVWVTGDLKFMGGPGSSLLLLFGIVFK